MVLRKRNRAEEADTSRVINLILAPVQEDVSNIAHILSGTELPFVRGQFFNSKASSGCPIFLAAPPILRIPALEGDFPNCFGYDD